MTTNVNPDPHPEGFQWQPTNKVTAIIDQSMTSLPRFVLSNRRIFPTRRG